MPVACHEVSDALEHLAAWETSAESDDEVAGQQGLEVDGSEGLGKFGFLGNSIQNFPDEYPKIIVNSEC